MLCDLFLCPCCSESMSEAKVCKSCHRICCRSCHDLVAASDQHTDEQCYWCKFESINCRWIPQLCEAVAGQQLMQEQELGQRVFAIFKCSVCLELIRNACMCPTCSHMLCSTCFRKSIKRNNPCPLCRQPVQQEDLIRCGWINAIVARLRELNGLPIENDETESDSADNEEELPEALHRHQLLLQPNMLLNFPPLVGIQFPAEQNLLVAQNFLAAQNSETTEERSHPRQVPNSPRRTWQNFITKDSCKSFLLLVLVALVAGGWAHGDVAKMKIFEGYFQRVMSDANTIDHRTKMERTWNDHVKPIRYDRCVRDKLSKLVFDASKSLYDLKSGLKILNRCLQKQHRVASEAEPPCYLLLTHSDTVKGKASASRFIYGISNVLGECSSFLGFSSKCFDVSTSLASKSSCVVWRDLHLRSSHDVELRRKMPSAWLNILTMGLPDGYALTQGAALYRLKTLWNVENVAKIEGPFNVDNFDRLLDGNVIPLE